jgi:hypothetical protein
MQLPTHTFHAPKQFLFTNFSQLLMYKNYLPIIQFDCCHSVNKRSRLINKEFLNPIKFYFIFIHSSWLFTFLCQLSVSPTCFHPRALPINISETVYISARLTNGTRTDIMNKCQWHISVTMRCFLLFCFSTFDGFARKISFFIGN